MVVRQSPAVGVKKLKLKRAPSTSLKCGAAVQDSCGPACITAYVHVLVRPVTYLTPHMKGLKVSREPTCCLSTARVWWSVRYWHPWCSIPIEVLALLLLILLQ